MLPDGGAEILDMSGSNHNNNLKLNTKNNNNEDSMIKIDSN